MTRMFYAKPASGEPPPHSTMRRSNSKGHHDNFRLTVVFAETATLKPSPHRAKIHSEEQIAQVAESIQSFGFLRQILVGKDREIIAGHAIYEAAKRLGRTEVPISASRASRSISPLPMLSATRMRRPTPPSPSPRHSLSQSPVMSG
ncbi:MAG: ParB domain-containing protein nuclease [Xanthobacteraceae bacterium]|nr:MAG: ParB domain-containing protein nuclease [Xanthobacteraceae bacterium]